MEKGPWGQGVVGRILEEPYPQDSRASFLGLSSVLKANVSQSQFSFQKFYSIKSFSCFAGFSLGNIIMSGRRHNSYFNEFDRQQCVQAMYIYAEVPPSVGAKLTLYLSWGSSSS